MSRLVGGFHPPCIDLINRPSCKLRSIDHVDKRQGA